MQAALLSLLFSITAFAQNSVADSMPLHTGDRWVYDYATRDDVGEGRAHLDVHHWRTEEVVTGSRTVPQGTLIEKSIRVIEGVPPKGWRVARQAEDLIRGDCVYTTDFNMSNLDRSLSPDFCFPLTIHKTWGARRGMPDWQVAAASGNTFHITSISSYPGAGITSDIWFEKGVGVVREVDIHHGTFGEYRVRLVRFEPVAR